MTPRATRSAATTGPYCGHLGARESLAKQHPSPGHACYLKQTVDVRGVRESNNIDLSFRHHIDDIDYTGDVGLRRIGIGYHCIRSSSSLRQKVEKSVVRNTGIELNTNAPTPQIKPPKKRKNTVRRRLCRPQVGRKPQFAKDLDRLRPASDFTPRDKRLTERQRDTVAISRRNPSPVSSMRSSQGSVTKRRNQATIGVEFGGSMMATSGHRMTMAPCFSIN